MYDGTLLTINSVYSTAVITANHIYFDVPAGELTPFLSTRRKLLLGFNSSPANEQKSFDVVKNSRPRDRIKSDEASNGETLCAVI